MNDRRCLVPLGVAAGLSLLAAAWVPGAVGTQAPAAAANGRIAFSRDNGRRSDDVFIVALATGKVRRLTSGRAKEWDPDLSPSGKRIVYRVNPYPRSDAADIWVMRADGRFKRNLTRAPRDRNWSPAWSPDGSKIAYASARGSGVPSLWVMNANGRAKHRVGSGPGEYPDWSPDGRRLVFAAADDSGTYDIYSIGIGGKDLTRLTHAPGTDFAPVWSPDGQTIAFQSDRDDRWRIWLMAPDGSQRRPLPQSDLGGAWPTWLSDARLAYSGQGLVTVDADGTRERRLHLNRPGAEFLSSGP